MVMKTLLFILLSWIVVNGLSAQNNHFVDMSVLSASKMQEERMKEKCLDSVWRAENIWNLGVLDMSGKPFKDLSVIESQDGQYGIMTWRNISLPRWFIPNIC